jgi:two-component system NarL family sensor kinase
MLLLVSATILVIFISNRKRLKQEMQMAADKLTYEKELRQVETDVSEQILARLGAELHDNVGQLLAAVRIHVENQKVDYPQLTESFKPAETYLLEAHEQVRMLSRTLNNEYIGRVGLITAMDVEIGRIKTLRKFEVHWQNVVGGSNLDKNQELMVFRIFQEIIQNCLRHAQAKNLYIAINNEGATFEMKIEDDGNGFDTEATFQSDKANGVRNIVKRAKLASMDCTINSAPGKGSTITIKKMAA